MPLSFRLPLSSSTIAAEFLWADMRSRRFLELGLRKETSKDGRSGAFVLTKWRGGYKGAQFGWLRADTSQEAGGACKGGNEMEMYKSMIAVCARVCVRLQNGQGEREHDRDEG